MNWSTASPIPAEGLFGRKLADACSGWLLYGDLEGWSKRTTTDRRYWLDRLLPFLEKRDKAFDVDGLRAFFHALTKADPDAGCLKQLRPASIVHVHTLLKALGAWLHQENFLPDNPMKKVPRPILRDDGIEPFTEEEIGRLLQAAKRTQQASRDSAILMLLLDSGLRNSELGALRIADVDLSAKTVQVRNGKGGKSRQTCIGKKTALALWSYVRDLNREPHDFLFTSERGVPLTTFTLAKICRRIARAAGVGDAHPHRWRHTFAISMLRNGANVFAVSAALGHSELSTTRIYCRIADADVRAAHRLASPVDNLKGTGR